MGACCICQANTETDGNLIDGSVFHRCCYTQLKETAERLSRTEKALLAELRKPRRFGESLAMFFSETRRRRRHT